MRREWTVVAKVGPNMFELRSTHWTEAGAKNRCEIQRMLTANQGVPLQVLHADWAAGLRGVIL